MVADAVVYHPSVAHLLKFLSTTLGRDKLYRTVQYFARFYAWYLLRTNATKEAVAPWAATKKQFGLLRKFLRLGKTIEHLKAAAVALDAKSSATGAAPDQLLRYTAVGRQLGYAGYLTFDAATVLDAAGIRKNPAAARLQATAYRFWAAGISCSVVAQVYTLYRLRQREAAVDLKDGEGVVESKRIAKDRSTSQTQLLCDACDFLVPAATLGWLALDDGIVGLTGTLSSIIGVRNQWAKTA